MQAEEGVRRGGRLAEGGGRRGEGEEGLLPCFTLLYPSQLLHPSQLLYPCQLLVPCFTPANCLPCGVFHPSPHPPSVPASAGPPLWLPPSCHPWPRSSR